MLERDTDWNKFMQTLREHRPVEIISRYFGVNMEQVLSYRDMLEGADFLREHSVLPPAIASYAIGFKYRHVIRWIETDDIKIARAQYDLGRVEMATGGAIVKDQKAWVLYSFPREKLDTKRPLYFSAPNFI